MKAQPVSIKLKEPIKWGNEETITELNLSVPKAKHVKNMNLKNTSIDDMIKLASKLSLVSEAALGELGMEDLYEVIEVVGNLLGAGREIGVNV